MVSVGQRRVPCVGPRATQRAQDVALKRNAGLGAQVTEYRADAAAFLLGAQRQLGAARDRLASAEALVRDAEANVKKTSDDVKLVRQVREFIERAADR